MKDYSQFNRMKYDTVLTHLKHRDYTLNIKHAFAGYKRSISVRNWDNEMMELAGYLNIIDRHLESKNYVLLKQFFYGLHNLPIASYKNDIQSYREIQKNYILKKSLEGTVLTP